MTRVGSNGVIVTAEKLIHSNGEVLELTCLRAFCEDDITKPVRDNCAEFLHLFYTLKNFID